MAIDNNIRAEFAAIQLYDGFDGFLIKKAGKSYKGYCPDLFLDDYNLHIVELSRNGLMQMLPEGMFSQEDSLSKVPKDDLKQKVGELQEQRKALETYFGAFDSLFFRQEVAIIKAVSDIEENRELFLLKEFYGKSIEIFFEKENYDFGKLTSLLLDRDSVKGNPQKLAFCIGLILHKEVSYQLLSSRYNEEGSIPPLCIRFIIHINGLSNNEYKTQMAQYKEFFEFIDDWFIPFDCELDYCIKDNQQPFVLGESLTLDYNTQL